MLRPPKKKKLERDFNLVKNGVGKTIESVDSQERHPGEVLDERIDQIALTETVLEEREPKISRTREDDGTCQPDLKTVQVVAVDVEPPSEQEIVHDRKECSRCETVCCAHR